MRRLFCGASFSWGGALAPRCRAKARPELKLALQLVWTVGTELYR